MTITEEHIHNWHVPAVQLRLSGESQYKLKLIAAAHERHHNHGTSARDEARVVNQLQQAANSAWKQA